MFELLPFFTHNPSPPTALNPLVNQEIENSKPAIPPKPVSRKIGVKIDMLRSARIHDQVEKERNQEPNTVINFEKVLVNPVVEKNQVSLEAPSSNKNKFLEER
jgi:hypothetical protein